MTFDSNSLCPGGTGKKIKHCDCRDIAGELEKIGKALEGGQRVAALDRINRVLATKANRPCLLALKAGTLMQMNELQSFEDTVTTFVKVAPQNSYAHCYASILESRKHRLRESLDAMQSVFECVDDRKFPGDLILALAQLIELAVHSNEYLAARAHAMLLSVFAPEEEVARNAMMTLSGLTEVPLIMKDDRSLMTCPEGVSWKPRFEAALADGNQLRWRKSLGKFEKLNEDFPQTPAILWNMALLRSLLALSHQAEAWRAFARCPGAEPKQAIEAEALAQLLRYRAESPDIALMKWTAEVTDANELLERLTSTPGVVSLPIDPRFQERENEPPPKGIFHLLDRPVLADGDEVSLENVPRRLASLMLYGRETDRPARLVAVLIKSDSYDSTVAKVNEIGGNLFTGERQEEVIDMLPRLMAEVDPACHFSPRTRPKVRQQVSNALTQQRLQERWPHIPVECLGGKSPAEVVADPAWRIPLEAALAVLDATAEVSHAGWNVDAVRQSVGLPALEPVVLTGDPDEVPLPDLSRIDLEKLTNEQLVRCYTLARFFAANKARLRFGLEVLRRGCLETPAERYQLLLELAQQSDDHDASIGLLVQARKEAAAANLSPAAALLAEFSHRLFNGDAAEAQEILNTLQSKHMREPGVPELLFRLLREHGIIRDEHLESMQQAAMSGAPPQPPPAADTGSALWTPDAPAPSGEGERPSKLWLPD